MRRLQIEIGERSSFDVIDEYGRRSGVLTLGEMIEQILSIARPQFPSPRYPMATEEGWAERHEFFVSRNRNQQQTEAAALPFMRDALAQWAAAEREGDATEIANARAERDRLLALPVDAFADVPF